MFLQCADRASSCLAFSVLRKLNPTEASWLLVSSMLWDLVYAKLFPFNLSTISFSSTNAARDWVTILFVCAGAQLDRYTQDICSQQDTLGGKTAYL
jgi:hypothetical protein